MIAERRGPLRVRPHEVEDGLVRHAVERDFRDRESSAPGAPQALAESATAPRRGPDPHRTRRGRAAGRDVPARRLRRRAIEEQLPVEARRHPLVPEEEAVDVGVLAGAGGEHVVDRARLVLLDLAMADRLDRAEDRGPEQLAGAGGERGRRPLADLAQHHVGAGPLQRGGAAFEIDDEHGRGHDRDQAGDQQPLRREPAPPGRRQRGRARARRAPSRRGIERDGGADDVGERGALHASRRRDGAARRAGRRFQVQAPFRTLADWLQRVESPVQAWPIRAIAGRRSDAGDPWSWPSMLSRDGLSRWMATRTSDRRSR